MHLAVSPMPSGAIRVALAALLVLASTALEAGETIWRGTLGRQRIELVAETWSTGDGRGLYAYERYDTPIRLRGTLAHGVLTLVEEDADGKVAGTFGFADFGASRTQLDGQWIGADGRVFPVALAAVEPVDWTRRVLQAASTRDRYFRLVTNTGDADSGLGVRAQALEVYAKGSDVLLQTIELDTYYLGVDSVSVGDYNFDGVADVAVFESSAAGPNTTSLYFLRHGNRYVASTYAGVSLEFDEVAKRIHETNSCCAGTSVMKRTYKVVNDRMVMLDEACSEWDDKVGRLVDAPCDE